MDLNRSKYSKVGTLNCRGITCDLKPRQLATDMDDYKLDILFLQETHLKGKGEIQITSFNGKTYNLNFSGSDINSKSRNCAGVGIILKANIKYSFVSVSERICYIKYKVKDT